MIILEKQLEDRLQELEDCGYYTRNGEFRVRTKNWYKVDGFGHTLLGKIIDLRNQLEEIKEKELVNSNL